MADDPSSKADKRLRAYAKKRQSELGAGFQMPPATRRALQAEVERRIPREREAATGAVRQWWTFWPRFAVGASILGLVLTGTYIGLRREHLQTARANAPAEPSARDESTRIKAAVQAVETVSSEQAADAGKAALAQTHDAETLSFDLPVSPPRADATVPEPQIALRMQPTLAARSYSVPALSEKVALAKQEASTGVSPTPDGASASLQQLKAEASIDTNDSSRPLPAAVSATDTQWTREFSRANTAEHRRRNFNSPPEPALLTRFSVTRNGDLLEVRDADGSAYHGRILPGDGSGTNAALSFEATGTSRTLKRTVTIAGTLTIPAEKPGAQPTMLALEKKEARDAATTTSAGSSILSPAEATLQIRARVVVTGQTQFELIARPVPSFP